MPVIENTASRGYQLPHATNNLDYDVARLRASFNAIDADVAGLLTSVAGKAAAGHAHVISDVSGLQSALDAKMAANASIPFDFLSDVNVAAAVANQFLRRSGADWIPVTLDGSMIEAGTVPVARLPAHLATPSLNAAYAALVHSHAIGDVTGLQAALDVIPGRNAIINGNFDIWQRGTSFSCPANAVTYTADRWGVFSLGAAVTADRVANTISSKGFYSLRITGASGNTRANVLQRIESANAIALQSVVCKVQFWAVASTNMTLTWSSEHASSQDNFGSTVAISSGTINVTTTPQLFTIDVASSGSTFNGVVLTVGANSGLGAGQSFTITQVGYSIGSVAYPFLPRPIQTEFDLCQRYYYRTADTANNSFSVNSGFHVAAGHPTGAFRHLVLFPVRMRAAGTVTIYDSLGNAGRYSAFTTAWTDNNSALTLGPSITPAGFYIGHNLSNSIETQFAYVANAEL
jgi:hypothetical protein